MPDKFSREPDQVSAPARRAFAITPHATAEIDPLPKAVRFGTAGTVAFKAADSTADVQISVAAGETVDIRMSHIRAAGTTATGIVGLA